MYIIIVACVDLIFHCIGPQGRRKVDTLYMCTIAIIIIIIITVLEQLTMKHAFKKK